MGKEVGEVEPKKIYSTLAKYFTLENILGVKIVMMLNMGSFRRGLHSFLLLAL
jgi:hypothetical protein